MKKIFVVIICQQPLFRAGIEHSLSKIGDIELLQAGELQEDALSRLDAVIPDVVIVNVDDFSNDRFKIVREIKRHQPSIGVIIISNNDDDKQIFQALQSQAAAYLTSGVTTEELVNTVRRVANGEYPINESLIDRPGVASQVVDQFQGLTLYNDEGLCISQLTSREIEVLDYVAQGYPNKQIADKFEISEQTIKNHVTSILRKLNANSRTEAVVQAIRQGLILLS